MYSYKSLNGHVFFQIFCYKYPCVNVCEVKIGHLLHLFIRYIMYPLCIENRSVKRVNSYFTICSLLTPTHIIFTRQKVIVPVLLFLLKRVKNI